MDISNPRRILAVGKPNSGLLDFVKGLTGRHPLVDNDSIAGTTHYWMVKTNYYTATIPIWLDEITSATSWAEEFLSPDARNVLNSLGAFIICFRKPIDLTDLEKIKCLLHNVAQVIKQGCGIMWDGVCLALAMPQSATPHLEKSFDEWEDLCRDSGFEFVDFEMKGRNEFLEPLGIERLKEALESNDWESHDQLKSALDWDDDDNEVDLGFEAEATQIKNEMNEMRHAINHDEENTGNEEDEVEKLQVMMLKIQAARDIATTLPDAEKKRVAVRAVNEVLKTL